MVNLVYVMVDGNLVKGESVFGILNGEFGVWDGASLAHHCLPICIANTGISLTDTPKQISIINTPL